MYNPRADAWRGLSNDGAPSSRSQPMVAWTGRLVLVWGGRSNGALFGDGAMYDVKTAAWTTMSAANAPTPRTGRAVWADPAMLIWGGEDWVTQSALDDGAAFYPPTPTP